MRKKPVLTAIGMAVIAWVYRTCVAQFATDTNILINQLPAFLDVYALGMLGAMVYCRLRLWMKRSSRLEKLAVHILTIGLFLIGCMVLVHILKVQSAASVNGFEALRLSQMAVRLPLAVTILVMMLSASFWPQMLQKLLDNRLMRFLSSISMNLYIWHQVLAVQMRKAWFPDTDLLHTDPRLQKAYMLLCISVAVLFAMAVTFGLEQPFTRWINNRRKKRA
jgi:peptidoglycan/LPS O-acetylase OafA/YrhL